VEQRRDQLRVLATAIRRSLGPSKRVALLHFPDHENVGDSAIWLGQRKLLRQIGVDVVYAASSGSYRSSDLKHCLGRDGTIVIQGGGSFGDIWPEQQDFRYQILSDHPSRRIVQFPQSLHFGSVQTQNVARDTITGHSDFALMVRDRASLELAQSISCSEVYLTPDSAIALQPKKRLTPHIDVLWLLRKDVESLGVGAERLQLRTGYQAVDWPPDPLGTSRYIGATRAIASTGLRARRQVLRGQWQTPLGRKSALRYWDSRAERRLIAGLELLSTGRVVVTDRLHAAILCDLLGIPCVRLDNTYGKVFGYFDLWPLYSGSTYCASSIAEAQAIADSLSASMPERM
jgi:exopolysaccharide biosynthesis predicted pyruvyltransferase EpsI